MTCLMGLRVHSVHVITKVLFYAHFCCHMSYILWHNDYDLNTLQFLIEFFKFYVQKE